MSFLIAVIRACTLSRTTRPIVYTNTATLLLFSNILNGHAGATESYQADEPFKLSWSSWIETYYVSFFRLVEFPSSRTKREETERLDRERLEQAKLIASERRIRELDAAARAARERDRILQEDLVRARNAKQEKLIAEKLAQEREQQRPKKREPLDRADTGCPGQFIYNHERLVIHLA